MDDEKNIHYEVFESRDDETETIESFDSLIEALGFLFTLFENKKGAFYVDKWIGHGLNSIVEAIDVF